MVFPTAQTNRASALLARKTSARTLADKGPIPAGMIDFRWADLTAVAKVYQGLSGRPVELDAGLPEVHLVLKNQTPLSPGEALRALDLLLAWHGLEVVELPDDKTLKVVRPQGAQRTSAEAPTPTK
jgi:hypothetical protein